MPMFEIARLSSAGPLAERIYGLIEAENKAMAKLKAYVEFKITRRTEQDKVIVRKPHPPRVFTPEEQFRRGSLILTTDPTYSGENVMALDALLPDHTVPAGWRFQGDPHLDYDAQAKADPWTRYPCGTGMSVHARKKGVRSHAYSHGNEASLAEVFKRVAGHCRYAEQQSTPTLDLTWNEWKLLERLVISGEIEGYLDYDRELLQSQAITYRSRPYHGRRYYPTSYGRRVYETMLKHDNPSKHAIHPVVEAGLEDEEAKENFERIARGDNRFPGYYGKCKKLADVGVIEFRQEPGGYKNQGTVNVPYCTADALKKLEAYRRRADGG